MTNSGSARTKLQSLSKDKARLLQLLLHKSSGQVQEIRPYPRNLGSHRAWLPAAGVQQRLWFIDQLEGSSGAYHIPLVLRLQGGLDRGALQWALDGLVERHEILRTVFSRVEGEAVQEIEPSGRFALEYLDLRGVAEREAQILRHSREELLAPFDLSAGPLIRGRLLQCGEREHVLLITMHHIISDGWSLAVFIRELGALYEARLAGRGNPLVPLPIQYADYAQWQREWASGADLQQQVKYWREHLQDAPALLELPTDRPRPAVQSYRGATTSIWLGSELTGELKALARRLNLTLAMVLYTAWVVLLSRLSGQQDLVVGVPVANRRRTELEGLIGFFINTLAVRVRLQDDPTVLTLLERVKEILLGAYAHQDVPFEKVVEATQPERSLSHSPIFQVMFVLQNMPRSTVELPQLALTQQQVPLYASKFDLALELQESQGGIAGILNYATDLFDAPTMQRWAERLQIVLQGMVSEPQLPVSRLPVMSEQERHQVVELFNATQAPYPQDKLIHELFEEQVERTPDTVAVLCEGTALSYAELNGRANQLARYLQRRGVGPDCLVGICVERSIEMVIGLLGILKAGGAYVPLDPTYPTERLQYMLEDAAPQVLLTQQHLRERLPATSAAVIALDAATSESSREASTNLHRPSLQLTSRSLAYVIYTSGSTGQPKGVAAEHRGMVNRIAAQQTIGPYADDDICCQKTSIGFVDAIFEIVGPLCYGRSLVLAPAAASRDIAQLIRAIDTEHVTRLVTVPSLAQALLEAMPSAGSLQSLRGWTLSGEELRPELLRKLEEGLPNCTFTNLYGSSEVAADVTYYVSRRATEPDVSIGRPLANTTIHILDSHLQPVPIGAAGEIYVGGVCVARGYLNRSDLTQQKFLPDPFSSDPHARLYKSGDRGRWHDNGTIQYLGRSDQQVKIRGFRIELGEIETQLQRQPGVKGAVTVVREDVPGDKRLVAYVVADESVQTAAQSFVDALRSQLKAVLPEYMVPAAMVLLSTLPVTPSGKVDRRGLPRPGADAYATRSYEPPRTPTEEIVASIWQSLLQVTRVGRHDNFFELGGHSLLIVQMLERLRRVGLATEVRTVFDSATLAELASVVESGANERIEAPPNMIPAGCTALTPQMLPMIELEPAHIERIVCSVPGGAANVQDIYPLVPLQEGILFHHLMSEQRGDAYVLATLLCVSSRQRVSELLRALQAVVDRHDVLRTSVLWDGLPRPLQIVHRHAQLSPAELALRDDRDPQQQVEEWLAPERQRLDLQSAPSMRLQMAENSRTGECYVLLQLHHMFADAQSFGVVIEEAIAHLDRRAGALPPAMPYRTHVARALVYANKHDAERFFSAKLAHVDEPTAPFGLLSEHQDKSEGGEARQDLELSVLRRVREQARRFGVSTATLFHSAWSLVVAHTSGRDDVVFGTVLLGRLHGDAGAQPVLGMFINTLPLRLQLSDVTARELVERVQRELAELLDHEQASLAVAQRCSGLSGTTPLFTSLLNYRHGVATARAQWSHADGVRVLALRGRTNYPIAMSIDDAAERLTLTAQTDRTIDPARVNGYMQQALLSLLSALEQTPQRPALQLTILPQAERRQVIQLFNATHAPYPKTESIQVIFEAQVARSPDAVAVVCERRTLTYSQLNSAANRLARHLVDAGTRMGEYVPVLLPRSLPMLVAQLAVLKAGGVYVPIDRELPLERLAFMLRDCSARLAIADRGSASNRTVDPSEGTVRWIDYSSAVAQSVAQSADNLGLGGTGNAPAYVMYTSGSTGVPKGVVVPHHAVNRLVINNGYAPIEPTDCLAHYSNPTFDASTFEVFGALLNGAKLLIVPQDVVLDAARFGQLLVEEHATILWMTVGLFNQYTEDLADTFSRLRYLIVGGDSLDPGAIRRVLNSHRPEHLLNAYGPTECTTFSTTHLIGTVEEDAKSIPIGRPIANAQVYLLDRRQQPVPIDVIGELYVGGDGVALGYLSRPELTAERFVADPFSSDSQARLYRTGDLGRWRPDGVIEFLGRNDQQVKVRGFRVELGEIEAQLTQHTEVSEAVVVAKRGAGEKRLVAYVVVKDVSRPPAADELRAFLKMSLPEYMLPAAFVVIERMPLTATGKVNRRALPEPDLDAYASRQYQAPESDVERTLAAMWRDVLAVDRVGRDDNFFDLGAHSLLALKALVKINQTLATDLKVADIYRCPTVRELSIRACGSSARDKAVELSREAMLGEAIVAQPGRVRTPAKHVILTGATGFVGRFLLDELLRTTAATVHCLVRAGSQRAALVRVHDTLRRWNLWRDEFAQRIVAVPSDLRAPNLGIQESTYEHLCDTVDSIFHCATSMNHLETYEMAKPANVGSAYEILRIATRGCPKSMNCISTLSVFGPGVDRGPRTVHEASPIDHERHLASSGYAASKWVSEKIFMSAAARGVPCNIFRLGLVWADTQQGRYDELQREYRIVKTCLLSGLGIRGYRYLLPPTPVDYVAQAVINLANRYPGGQQIFHVSATRQTIDGVFERCNEVTDARLELVPFYDWVNAVKRLHEQGSSMPAVPLIEFAFSMSEPAFYEHWRALAAGVPRIDCARTHRQLERADIVAPIVNDELLRIFVEQTVAQQTREGESTGVACDSVIRRRDAGSSLSLGRWL